jgi:hypothetical protein
MHKIGKAALAAFALATIAMIAGCSGFGRNLATRLYPALPEVFDMEAPPTPQAVSASADIVATLGGRGQGLNCSIPTWTQSLFLANGHNAAPVSLQFRQGCAYHDFCYRHGEATYGYTQADCDFALQRFAYRLCRQIEKNSGHKECEARAREVLLGVRLGGNQAFQAGGDSTYFEFDPIPEHADDYVVARVVKPTTNADHADVVALLFRHNTVATGTLPWGETRGGSLVTKALPWLDKHIATPPSVIRLPEGDALVALSRSGATRTGMQTVRIRYGDSPKLEYLGDDIDHEASTAVLRATPEGQLQVVSFSHRESKKHPGVAIGTSIVQPGEPAAVYIPWELSVPERNKKQPLDYYRLLQHPPILVKRDGALTAVVVKRGEGATGGDYKKNASLLLFPLGAAGGTETEQAPIAEINEPLVAVETDDSNSLLVSLVEAGGKNGPLLQPFSIRPKIDKLPPLDLGGSRGIDNTWLKQSVQLVRRPGGGVYVFFSRVCLVDGPCGEMNEPLKAGSLYYEFRYFKWLPASGIFEMIGNARVKVDLREQFDWEFIANTKMDEANKKHEPVELHGISKNMYDTAEEGQEVAWREAVQANLATRWQQSQVIPAYIGKPDAGAPEVPLDIAVVFKGYPGQSLRLTGVAVPGKPNTLRIGAGLKYAQMVPPSP